MATTDKGHTKTIPLKKLDPTRYRFWVAAVSATLSVYNCLNIVLGDEPRPTIPDGANDRARTAAEKLITNWDFRHAQAREAIINSLPEQLLVSVYRTQQVTDIWQWLRDRLGAISDLEYSLAEKAFRGLVKPESTSMKDHIDSFLKLQEQRDFVAPPDIIPLTEREVSVQFLASLGPAWKFFRQAMGAQANALRPAEVFAQAVALELEDQAIVPTTPSSSTEPNVNFTRTDRRFSQRGKGSGNGFRNNSFRNNSFRNNGYRRNFKPRRFKFNSRSRSFNSSGENRCYYCQQTGHTRDECFKKKWADNQWRRGSRIGSGKFRKEEQREEPDNTPIQWNTHVTIASCNLASSAADPYEWMIDSASNAYLTPYKERFDKLIEFDDIGTVKGLGGKRVSAYGSGSVILTDHSGVKHTIKDVLYVPESEGSILSLMKLKRIGFDFHLLEDNDSGDFLLSHNKSGIVFKGDAINDILYIHEKSPDDTDYAVFKAVTRSAQKREMSKTQSLEEDFESDVDQSIKKRRLTKNLQASPSKSPPATKPATCNPPEHWHLCLDHAANGRLSKLPYIKSIFDTTKCISCIRAKAHRTPFRPATPRTTHKGQLIHSDIAGPFKVSRSHGKYVLTFLDDYTHFCWICVLPDKSSKTVRNAFTNWIKEFENKGLKIKYLRTDGGGEYEGQLTPLLKSLGITHQVTAPYSPQSNGKAERLNRTLADSVRAMLYHANMPESFWDEAMQTAAVVLNYLPSDAIDSRIPWEVWHEQSLSLDTLHKLHPFGTIVRVYTDRQRRWTKGKLAVKATHGCFLGYKPDITYEPTNSYKYWDFDRKCISESSNIHFTDQFPSRNAFDEPPLAPPIPPGIMPSDDDTPAMPAAQWEQPPSPNPEPAQTAPVEPRPIHDSIIVQPEPIQVFSTQAAVPDNDPPSYAEAIRRSDRNEWIKAMQEELDAIFRNKTWKLVELPRGRKCIGTRWVFRMKKDGHNKVERYKARLVVKGNEEIPGKDFDKTFAPVVRIESVRMLLAIAALFGLEIIHIDCKNAFLNGLSDIEIYVSQPEGFISKRFPSRVYLLNKSLYGLKQAPRIWYLTLCEVIVSLGFMALESDTSIYINASIGVILTVYVDDILVFAKSITTAERIYQQLAKHYAMKNLGFPKTFLGLNIIRTTNRLPSQSISLATSNACSHAST